jgi:hypothetical protein
MRMAKGCGGKTEGIPELLRRRCSGEEVDDMIWRRVGRSWEELGALEETVRPT